MKNQSFKKQISTATFFFIILFFAALDLESKGLNNSFKSEEEPILITCPPGLVDFPTPGINVRNSCSLSGGMLSGGAINGPISTCPTGSVFQYSVQVSPSEPISPWSDEVPIYNQTNSIVIFTRCNCLMDNSISSIVNELTTSPGTCPICSDDLIEIEAPVVSITNSTCTAVGGTPNGGEIRTSSTSCPSESSIQYSTNNGTTWSTTLPTYSQSTTMTILTRCLCDDNSIISKISSITTKPGMCPLTNTPIPTMSQWGLIIFGLLILNIGVIILYRLERILV